MTELHRTLGWLKHASPEQKAAKNAADAICLAGRYLRRVRDLRGMDDENKQNHLKHAWAALCHAVDQVAPELRGHKLYPYHVNHDPTLEHHIRQAICGPQDVVTVIIEGGLVTDVSKPPGIKVNVRDYDVEGADEDEVETDEEGRDFRPMVFR